MDYLFIVSAVVSVAAFVGFVSTTLRPGSRVRQVRVLALSAAVATAFFWGWFYLEPGNPVSQRTWERTLAVRSYDASAAPEAIAEGDFGISFGQEKTIILPPFAQPPEVTLYRDKGGDVPQVTRVTRDSMTVWCSSSDAAGRWSFRARGAMLKRTAP